MNRRLDLKISDQSTSLVTCVQLDLFFRFQGQLRGKTISTVSTPTGEIFRTKPCSFLAIFFCDAFNRLD